MGGAKENKWEKLLCSEVSATPEKTVPGIYLYVVLLPIEGLGKTNNTSWEHGVETISAPSLTQKYHHIYCMYVRVGIHVLVTS